MELQIILLAIVLLQAVSTVVIILVVKNFFRQLMEGMGSTQPTPTIFSPKTSVPFYKEEKNDIPEPDPDDVEFSEDNPMNLPSNLKFEVEGGETFAPPDFPVRDEGVNHGR